MQDEGKAILQWNVIELVKNIASLGNNPGIYHEAIPGGKETLKEALKQGLLIVTHKSKTYNNYRLTFDGLMVVWEYSNTEDVRLISRAVN